jgi:hypothetical protein
MWSKVLLAGVLTISACNTPTPVPTPLPFAFTQPHISGIQIVAPNSHVTGTYRAVCRRSAGDDVRLPVASCTPGAIRGDMLNPTNATLSATVCHPDWTATVRPPTSETDRTKTAAMKAYGETTNLRPTVELDHLIPLELGGANDVSNLWPEISDEPGQGFHNSKDKVENNLKDAVCDHRIAIADGQNAIATNWTTAETKLGVN